MEFPNILRMATSEHRQEVFNLFPNEAEIAETLELLCILFNLPSV